MSIISCELRGVFYEKKEALTLPNSGGKATSRIIPSILKGVDNEENFYIRARKIDEAVFQVLKGGVASLWDRWKNNGIPLNACLENNRRGEASTTSYLLIDRTSASIRLNSTGKLTDPLNFISAVKSQCIANLVLYAQNIALGNEQVTILAIAVVEALHDVGTADFIKLRDTFIIVGTVIAALSQETKEQLLSSTGFLASLIYVIYEHRFNFAENYTTRLFLKLYQASLIAFIEVFVSIHRHQAFRDRRTIDCLFNQGRSIISRLDLQKMYQRMAVFRMCWELYLDDPVEFQKRESYQTEMAKFICDQLSLRCGGIEPKDPIGHVNARVELYIGFCLEMIALTQAKSWDDLSYILGPIEEAVGAEYLDVRQAKLLTKASFFLNGELNRSVFHRSSLGKNDIKRTLLSIYQLIATSQKEKEYRDFLFSLETHLTAPFVTEVVGKFIRERGSAVVDNPGVYETFIASLRSVIKNGNATTLQVQLRMIPIIMNLLKNLDNHSLTEAEIMRVAKTTAEALVVIEGGESVVEPRRLQHPSLPRTVEIIPKSQFHSEMAVYLLLNKTGRKRRVIQVAAATDALVGAGAGKTVKKAINLLTGEVVARGSYSLGSGAAEEQAQREVQFYATLKGGKRIATLLGQIKYSSERANGELKPKHALYLPLGDSSLDKLLQKVRDGEVFLSLKNRLIIASQIAEGLVEIHSNKLVHKDIKDGNVVVSMRDDGVIDCRIIDLGLTVVRNHDTVIGWTGAFAPSEFIHAVEAEDQDRIRELHNSSYDIFSFGRLMERLFTDGISNSTNIDPSLRELYKDILNYIQASVCNAKEDQRPSAKSVLYKISDFSKKLTKLSKGQS